MGTGENEMKIARRIVFVVLNAALLFGVVMRETSSSSDTIFMYAQVIQNALLLLLVWFAIFVRSEPTLTRFGVVLVLISFVLIFWVYKF